MSASISKLRTTAGRGPGAYAFGQIIPLALQEGTLSVSDGGDLNMRAEALPDGLTQRDVVERLGGRREAAIEAYKRSRKGDPTSKGR